MSTYELARRHGAGTILTDGATRYTVSDYSPSGRCAYGRRLDAAATYCRLPEGLRLHRAA